MGVRGLTSFIDKDSKRFLKPTKLRDTYLVIDGNCIASHLYKWCTKRDSAFGGDYEEYYIIVRKFFTSIKKCNISPIIIFDGGYEEKKLKTVLHRLKTKLTTLKTSFCNGFTATKYFPLFMKQIFFDALESLNVPVVQTEFEADGDIAALARDLGCPVLSYDSDFYIYDVLYVPFSSVELEVVTLSEFDGATFALQCSVYDVTDFLKQYPGLLKCHLPLLATMLGNDFVDSHVFHKFFNQIPLAKSKSLTATEKKIQGLLNWLRHESQSSAISKILMHLSKKDHQNVLKNIEANRVNYESSCSLKLDPVSGNITGSKTLLNIEDHLWELFFQCKLPTWIMDMITLQTYFLPLQIEDLKELSAHQYSIPIIQAIYKLVSSNKLTTNITTPATMTDGNENAEFISASPLKLYIRKARSIKIVNITPNYEQLPGPIELGRNDFFEIIGLTASDISCLDGFQEDQKIFMASFISWCKSGLPNVFHVYSLLLSFFVCQAKSHTGICKVGKTSVLAEVEVSAFNCIFSSYRKTSQAARASYSTLPVHVFNIFQSIIYHASVLNNLIAEPFKTCRMADSFCGTLVYNLFSDLAHRTQVEKYLEDLLGPAPEIAKIFQEFCDKLSRYFPLTPKSIEVEKKRKKRRKNKKSNGQVISTDMVGSDENESVDEYEDLNNKFHLLQVL